MTGEDLGYKPGVGEQAKFECSPLGEALNNKFKSKTNKKCNMVNTDKQGQNLIYNSQHSFAKFKDISDLKEFSLDSMHKNWMIFIKNLPSLRC